MILTLEQKTDNFTKLLHDEALKLGCEFFEDSGEGHDFETDTMYFEDVGGWLAPVGTPIDLAKKDENYRFAEWKFGDNNEVVIEFKKY